LHGLSENFTLFRRKEAASLLMNIPVFLMSRTGLLPHVEFFSVSGLTAMLAGQNFQIAKM
jgi:hypothetical protein